MKRLLTLALLLCGFLQTWADSWTDSDGVIWAYNVSGSEATITGSSQTTGDVVIPSTVNGYTVTSIGYRAFYWRTGLTSVSIPEGVTYIDSSAFSGCTNLTSIIVSTSNTKYDSRGNCNAIIETATNTLVTGCKTTIIPNTVASIGREAFQYCDLTSVIIPSSVTSIGEKAFAECTGLTSMIIPEGVTSIGGEAFSYTDLESVTILSSVTSIGYRAFSGCTNLTSIVVSTSNTKYDSRGNCNAIIETATNTLVAGCKTTIIPNTVTSIDSYAFAKCKGLTSMIIPEGVTSIGGEAFSDCYFLTSVTIPSSLTSISGKAFSGCYCLTSIVVSTNNTKYDSRGNCNAIIETATNTLVAGCKTTIIPNTVTSIDSYAFFGCTGLESLTIPEGVTSIGWGAFYNCSGLTCVTIPSSVTSIGGEAFQYCTGLESVTIPEGVTSIGLLTFRGCFNLTTITIPSSVTSIETLAFYECNKLTFVYSYMETPPAIVGYTFSNYRATLYVPEGSMAAYQSADYWKDFKLITTINDTDYSSINNTIYLEPAEALTDSQVTLSVKMKNTVEVQGYQFDLYLPEGVTIATDEDGFSLIELSTERTTARKTDYFNSTVQTDGSIRVLCGSSKGYTFEGNDGEVATITLNISEDMEEGDYPIILKEVNLTDKNSTLYTTNYLKTTLTVKDHVLGDVNGNKKVEVADFIATANYILGNPPQVFNIKAADVNGNNKIEVADFIGIANIILNGSTSSNAPAAAPKKSPRKTATDISTLTDVIYVEPVTATPGTQQTLSIQMKNSSPVAGFEFRLQLPEGITVATDDDDILMAELSTERTTARKTDYFNSALQADGTLQVLCGTSTANPNTGKPYTFNGNEGEVARITVNIPEDYSYGMYDVRATGVVISDANANILLLDNTTSNIIITSKTTSITNYDYELQNDDIWYTLNGQKLDKKPTKKGVYIVNGKRIVIK